MLLPFDLADDCGAFVCMFAWAVIYQIPFSQELAKGLIRSMRKHVCITVLRGRLHFRLPPKVVIGEVTWPEYHGLLMLYCHIYAVLI